MNRLKLTLENGKTFLSPFVYTDEQTQLRMRKLKWLLKNKNGKIIHTLEVIPVEDFLSIAPYNFDNVRPKFIRFLEHMWEGMENVYNRKDVEEVERGSA